MKALFRRWRMVAGRWFLILPALGVAAMAYAQYSVLPWEATVRYVADLPTSGFYPGQVAVDVGDRVDPIVSIWNQNDNAWEEVAGDGADLNVATVTTSGNVSLGASGNVVISGDNDGALVFSGSTGWIDFNSVLAISDTVGGTRYIGVSTSGVTFADNTTLGNNEDDTVTITSPQIIEVVREDFDSPTLTILDITNGAFAQSVADTEANQLVFQF